MAKCHENVKAVQRAWQEEFYKKNWPDKRTMKTAVVSTLCEVTSVRKLCSGGLLIEIKSRKQAQQSTKLKALSTIPITVSAHTSLNSSKGVITCGELNNVSIEEITNELKANNSAPETCTPRRSKSNSLSNRSLKLKLSKCGISSQQLTSKLKKSNVKNSVALGLASRGLVQKDLPSIFGGVPKSPDRIALYPSEGKDEEITMSCDVHQLEQAVAVQFHTRALVTVCCIYLPPHDALNQQQLNNLVDQLPKPFLLLGDFIGHSSSLGSDSINSLRRQIEQFISNNCLCLLNNDEKTYFHEPTRSFHSLDLAICSPDLLPLLNFEVGDDLHNSDHFPLIVSHADSGGASQIPPHYLFQRADWSAFMQLAGVTEAIVSIADISEAAQHVVYR
ncbi:hypothetical protein AVEN_224631-1 [Araneus ventricosus]|uniref:Endonuclease/exonuclease/phosphatase domain-containing protein n=1 Tax=Araneus ventricosus TaxID=182803 RepID=A0A4Y2QY12_ARAVE|nr:hypothetical protein AVEN_224631-1 [Araneus ventricosus]